MKRWIIILPVLVLLVLEFPFMNFTIFKGKNRLAMLTWRSPVFSHGKTFLTVKICIGKQILDYVIRPDQCHIRINEGQAGIERRDDQF